MRKSDLPLISFQCLLYLHEKCGCWGSWTVEIKDLRAVRRPQHITPAIWIYLSITYFLLQYGRRAASTGAPAWPCALWLMPGLVFLPVPLCFSLPTHLHATLAETPPPFFPVKAFPA